MSGRRSEWDEDKEEWYEEKKKNAGTSSKNVFEMAERRRMLAPFEECLPEGDWDEEDGMKSEWEKTTMNGMKKK